MHEVEHYHRPVATVSPEVTARELADRMKEEGIGSLVVVEGDRPVGIVTDRDLLRRVIVSRRDAESATARDVMSQPLVTARDSDPLQWLIQVMAEHGVRRVPIIRDGVLVGLVSLDDVFAALADEIGAMAEGVRRNFRAAQRTARARQLGQHLGQQIGTRAKDLSGQLERLGGEARHGLAEQLGSLRSRLRKRTSERGEGEGEGPHDRKP